MLELRLTRQNIKPNPLDARRRAREVGVNEIFVQAHGFKHLRATISFAAC